MRRFTILWERSRCSGRDQSRWGTSTCTWTRTRSETCTTRWTWTPRCTPWIQSTKHQTNILEEFIRSHRHSQYFSYSKYFSWKHKKKWNCFVNTFFWVWSSKTRPSNQLRPCYWEIRRNSTSSNWGSFLKFLNWTISVIIVPNDQHFPFINKIFLHILMRKLNGS